MNINTGGISTTPFDASFQLPAPRAVPEDATTQQEATIVRGGGATGPRPVITGSLPELAAGESTALQKHAQYFDLDKNGLISVGETRRAMKMLGLAGITAAPTALAINAGLGKSTGGTFTKVSVEGIAKGMHPGDTGVYNEEGRYDPAKLDELFVKFDADGDGALNLREVNTMIAANSARDNDASPIAARGEFYLLLDLAGQKDASGETVLTKERMNSFYTGDLFPQIAAERAAEAAANGTNSMSGKILSGISGLVKNFAGILGGRAAAATASADLTTAGDVDNVLASPLSGAKQALCPGLGG